MDWICIARVVAGYEGLGQLCVIRNAGLWLTGELAKGVGVARRDCRAMREMFMKIESDKIKTASLKSVLRWRWRLFMVFSLITSSP